MIKKIWNNIRLWWLSYKESIYQDDLSYQTLKVILMKKWPNCNLEITDLNKKVCDRKTLMSISAILPTKWLTYKREKFDCEDFAILAWGIWKLLFPRLAIGLCLVQKGKLRHAMNCAIYKTKSGYSFTMIEPQNGKVYLTDWTPYKIII